MEAYIILGSRWFTNPTVLFMTHSDVASIGIVAVRTNTHEPETAPLEWKAYIGVSSGTQREDDEQRIARMGSSLLPEEAQGFFPDLAIECYKSY